MIESISFYGENENHFKDNFIMYPQFIIFTLK